MSETTSPPAAGGSATEETRPGGAGSDMVQITFEEQGKTITVPKGSNLRKVARANGVDVYGGPNKVLNCLGNGMCGSDRVAVKPIADKRSFWEEFHLHDEPKLRLACRFTVTEDISVSTKPAVAYGDQRKEEIKLAGLAIVPGVLLLGGIVLIVLDFLGKF